MTKTLIASSQGELTIAAQLQAVQSEIAVLKVQEDALKDALLMSLKKQGVRRIDLENGDMYIRVPKTTLSVVKGFEADAMKFAKKRYALKVDTAKIKDILKMEGKLDDLPVGFKRTDTEYLRMAKQGSSVEDDE